MADQLRRSVALTRQGQSERAHDGVGERLGGGGRGHRHIIDRLPEDPDRLGSPLQDEACLAHPADANHRRQVTVRSSEIRMQLRQFGHPPHEGRSLHRPVTR